jgi:hypothetical protein
VVGARQKARVVIEAGQDAFRARAGIDGEARRQRQRAIIEAVRAEDVIAKRALAIQLTSSHTLVLG